jgi:hypothetical protein
MPGARTLVLAGGLAALALLGGCFVVNDPSDHQELSAVSADDFCAEFAAVVCDAHQRCCSTADPDREACVTNWSAICAAGVGSLAADPRTGYDGTVAAEVLAEGETLSASCSVDVVPWFESRMGFQRVLSGTVAGGDECTPRNALDIPAYFSCTELDQACVQVAAGRSICADLLGQGDPCHRHFDCAEGLYCEGGGTFTEGNCEPRLPEGEPCTANEACASQVCDTAGTMTCVVPDPDVVYCALAKS